MALTSVVKEEKVTTSINLTLLKVNGELDSILATYPAQIHKRISTDPDFRNKLLNYVLQKIPNHSIEIDRETLSAISSQALYCSTLEQLEIEELIQQGVYYLINQENKHFINGSACM